MKRRRRSSTPPLTRGTPLGYERPVRAKRRELRRSALSRAWLAMDTLDDRACALRERILRALGRGSAPATPVWTAPALQDEVGRGRHRERLLQRVAIAAEEAWGEWDRDGDVVGSMTRLRLELDTAAEFH
jgi:hypothetical protein